MVARLMLAVSMVFTYPLELYVARHCFIALLKSFDYELPEDDVWRSRIVFYGLSIFLWSLSLIIALFCKELAFVCSLTGNSHLIVNSSTI